MTTIGQLAKWLEEDGYPASAEDLLAAPASDRPHLARKIAGYVQSDPDGYDDEMSRALPRQLREWADAQEAKQTN